MKVAVALIAALISAPAVAQTAPPVEPQKMDVVDFSVDFKEMKKKRVTVTGCEFAGANNSWVFCYAAGNHGVHINIEVKSLDKEDRRRALRECGGVVGENDRCTGSVTGVAFDFMGLGAALQKAKIAWDKP